MAGIDLGTGGVRAIVVDAVTGAVLSSAAAEYPLLTPHPQWAEQRPEDWWRAAQVAIPRALRDAPPATELRAVGLTGQMHGLTLLDEQDTVIRPALLWCDQRTQAECDQIHEVVGLDRLRRIAANPALTGFTAPKLLWVRRHEPAAYRRVRRALLPKDYLRFLLSGEYATDVADASGTLLLDVARRDWSGELLDLLELPRAWLPGVHEGPDVCARVSATGAAATGLPEGLPIVAGGGDQAAGGVGNGIVRPGLVSCTIGTSGVVFAATDRLTPDPSGALQAFCHSVPGMWHVMGVTQAAGLSLRWVRDQLGSPECDKAARRGVDPYDLLIEQAERAPAGCEGLLYLPYLMGERAPHLDPQARGGWIGLTARHDRAALIRSVLEGVTYSLRDCLELLRELGVEVRDVRASGGGARSPFWRQLLADVFGLPVATLTAAEGPAYGAALLAAVGAGLYPDVPAACDATLTERERLSPDSDCAATYERYYAVYRALYPALREQFAALAQLATAP
ncbi:MAG TPA: xylulokinase [Chloroflexota bacterium]|nr:xylulokinase [Chloroflexota bacterium]